MADWMETLARQYADARNRYPDDRLLIVFDIDGTILDLRHMVRHVLLEYDRTCATSHFRGLCIEQIDVHEDAVDEFLARFPIEAAEQARIVDFYRQRCWQGEAILASHRPYRGVMEVIRWFQIQTNTDVALNTGRPESLRDQTLQSLNALGRECRVSFSNDLLYMNANGNHDRIAEAKVQAIRDLRSKGYRVVAIIDNEPLNIEAMLQADEEGSILFLHADTLFLSEARATPRTVSGKHYDLTRLLGRASIPERVQFVWHGVDRTEALQTFLSSPLQWCEADVRTDPYGVLVIRSESYTFRPWRREEDFLRFDSFVSQVMAREKSMKLDLHAGGAALDRVLGTLCLHGLPAERLWFNANIEDLGEQGFRLIRTVFPGATIQCPVDFLAPVLRAVPARAEETLETLCNWGIDRFSVGWRTEKKHGISVALENFGYAVNIYDVPDLRAFLEAALMLPSSLTARFADSSTVSEAGRNLARPPATTFAVAG